MGSADRRLANGSRSALRRPRERRRQVIQRDPADVIDAILKHVPTEMTDLWARLVVVRNDSFYDPPEYKYPSWRALRFVLETSLSTPPKADWEIKISDIVEGRVAVHEDPPYPNGPMSDEAARAVMQAKGRKP